MLAAMASLLKGHDVTQSLVHGDLWSGNARMLASGEAVVSDPAVHIGDREVDVAMKDLFGGFGAAFADSYREAWTLDDGYASRRDVYNLYRVLNRLNLFGRAYLARVPRCRSRALSAAR